ncbi:MAG TPA: glyceraldehyde-3-phosphate dehydrogenase, partial [Methanomicrobiales archaeon]|nr:glyceraldehyde-3-phosphate dehydrogenase [Methanomicrobiales archaeon]
STLMHMHAINMDLKKEPSKDRIIEIIKAHPRMGLVKKGMGITSSAELKEYVSDIGRPRSDLWENGIFEESLGIDGNELYLFQAIHQEADVVVENVDAIRAMTGTEKDPNKSVKMTNEALGFTAI